MKINIVNRVVSDFKQKELLPLKVVFFFIAASLFVLYPYFTIHMRELGITAEEAGVSATFVPVFAIIGPPVAGVIADRLGNFRILLSIMTVLSGIAALLLLQVPAARETIKYPTELALNLGCDDRNRFSLKGIEPYPCTVLEHQSADEIDLDFETCGYLCQISDMSLDEDVASTHYKISIGDVDVTDGDLKPTVYSEVDRLVFFPTKLPMDLSCVSGNDECAFHFVDDDRGIGDNSSFTVKARTISTGMKETNDSRHPLWTVDALRLSTPDEQFHLCNAAFTSNQTNVFINANGTTRSYSECRTQCTVKTPRKAMCSNDSEQLVHNVALTFWLYTFLRLITGLLSGTSFIMFEGAALAVLIKMGGDYGLQRIYAAVAGIIFSPLSGALIDWASTGKQHADFRPAFYLYAALRLVAAGLTLTINLEFRKPEKNVLKSLRSVLTNVEILIFFLAIFCSGTAWGFIESFLFWFLEDLGANKSLMGFTITVGGLAGIPLLILSGPIIKKIGHVNVLVLGLIFYAIRLTGYSFITHAAMCLPFEAMEAVTTSLAMTAAATYAAQLSTPSTIASIQGLMGGLYYGVGRGSGSLIGGYLLRGVGTRMTYRLFAIASLFTGFLYALYYWCYLRKRHLEAAAKKAEAEAAAAKTDSPAENGVANKEAAVMTMENGTATTTETPMEDIKNTETASSNGTAKQKEDVPSEVPLSTL